MKIGLFVCLFAYVFIYLFINFIFLLISTLHDVMSCD